MARAPHGTHSALVMFGMGLARRPEGVSRSELVKLIPHIGWKKYFDRLHTTSEELICGFVDGIRHYWIVQA